MSRLAKSSPAMWEDVFKQNRGNLLEAIELFEKELLELKNSIKNENWDDVFKTLQNGSTLYGHL